MRWSAIRRLAALGALTPEQIDDERRGDGTVVGELGAARALAAIPHPEAKARAWARMFEDPHVSNRMFEAAAEGFWDPEQVELVHPYVARYLAEAPAVARARGQAFSQLVGEGLPEHPARGAGRGGVRGRPGGRRTDRAAPGVGGPPRRPPPHPSLGGGMPAR